MTKTSGTKQWSDSSVNCYYGCSNDCVYCYAKKMALRFGRIQSEDEWKNMKPHKKNINKGYKKRKGRIMFPTSHDITSYSYPNCLKVLLKLLKAGNEVLITTKPDEDLIYKLCVALYGWKDQILFRFTITSFDDRILNKYEPYAPSYRSRYESVWDACDNFGYKTSLSIEPFLDKDPTYLITRFFETLENGRISGGDIITDTIWLGIMSGKVPEELKQNYTKENLELIIEKIRQLPEKIRSKIRLKDSITNMGLLL